MSTPYQQNAKTSAGPIAATPAAASWGGFRGLLTEYTGASAGYSLRKIGNGPVVRLRRASDNAEKDFYAGEVVAGTAGAELVPNTDFSTTDDWELTTPAWSITGGQLVFDGSVAGFATPINLTESYVEGDYYIVSFDIAAQTGTGNRINIFFGTRPYLELEIPTSGAQSVSLIARYGGAGLLGLYSQSGSTVTYNNFSVKPYTPSVAELWAFENYEGIYTRQTSESAYATTWYDQSGSGNDATQTTAAAQPLLIRAGVTNTVNGKAALSFDGTDDFFDANSAYLDGVNLNSEFHVTGDIPTVNNVLHDGTTSSVDKFYWQHYFVAKRAAWGATAGSVLSTGDVYDVGQSQYLTSGINTGSALSIYSSGSQVGTNAASVAFDSQTMFIGKRNNSTDYLDSTVQELIFYPSDQSANRTGIETNINDHYGIY